MRRASAIVLLGAALASFSQPTEAPADTGPARLLAARCPRHYALPLGPFTHHRIAAARRGVAIIGGRRRRLDPPIDWRQNPFHSYPWQKKLNELTWIEPLIYADLNGSRPALKRATRVVLDWIRQNPKADPQGFRTAWEGKRAGERLGVIAFVGRRAACRGLLSTGEVRRIVDAVEVHAAFLLRDASRGGQVTNHALFRDEGLLVAARYYGFLPGASHWRRTAVHRFEAGIAKLVDRGTGVDLEQTPGYEQKIVERVQAFLRPLNRPARGLERLLRRMKRDVAWFTMPDGDIVPIADTPFYKRSPRYARSRARRLMGLSPFLRDGFAVARRHHSYLATTAGYHRAAHKHADELSFDLFDAGRRVIVDSGRRDHTQVAKRLPGPNSTAAFTRSSFAHSTLVVDGRSFNLNRHPYGSGLDAQGRGGGWFAVLGHNPLLRTQGVRQRRLWLYRPGKALVVVDTLRARRRHTYSRFLQIAPKIHAAKAHGFVRLRARAGFRGAIWTSKGSVRLYRGDVKPLRGWYVRGGYHSLTPRYTERLTTKARNETLISAIGLTKRPVRARAAGHNSYVVRVPGSKPVKITVRRHGRRLHVRAAPR